MKTIDRTRPVMVRNSGDAYPFPRKEIPEFMVRLAAPKAGLTRRFVSRNVGYRAKSIRRTVK